MVVVLKLLMVLRGLLPWIGVTYLGWKLESAGATDAVARDVRKVADGGGKVLDAANNSTPILIGAVLVAVLLLRR